METPDIVISFIDGFEEDVFESLAKEMRAEEINVLVDRRPEPGPYMGLEWFIPTAAIIFIATPLVNGFLEEAGKELFAKVKATLAGSTNRVMNIPRIEPVVFASTGKVQSENPYSMALSIYAEANDGHKFKLLLPKPGSGADYTEIIYAFLDFLNDFHSGVKNLGEIGYDEGQRPMGGLILVHMNLETKSIEWLNHRL